MKTSGKFKKEEKEFKLSDSDIQQVIDESVSEWDEDYARLYISKISPEDFLKLTANDSMMVMLEENRFDLDLSQVENKKYVADMMYLDIDLETGEVRGHEGRHRMYSLKNAGYKEAEIVVFPYNYSKYNAEEYKNKRIYAQEGGGSGFTDLEYLIPVSKRNKDRIKNRRY